MKTKRSGYLRKSPQTKKKEGVAAPNMVVAEVESQDASKQKQDCDGCCSINWKPASLAR
jgi:hypothetical protein